MIVLTENTDLNDINEAGTYRCDSAAVSSTLKNCPVTGNFKLIVDKLFSVTLTQRIVCVAGSTKMYHRVKTNGTYSDWVVTNCTTINNLTSSSYVEGEALSAYQGKVLNDLIDSKQDKLTNPLTQSDVINNLTSTTTTKPLSAYQGKVLNDSINSKLATYTGTTCDINSTNVSTLHAFYWKRFANVIYVFLEVTLTSAVSDTYQGYHLITINDSKAKVYSEMNICVTMLSVDNVETSGWISYKTNGQVILNIRDKSLANQRMNISFLALM